MTTMDGSGNAPNTVAPNTVAPNPSAMERAELEVKRATTRAGRALEKQRRAEERMRDIQDHPEMYTTGALIRRRRPWHKCRKWRCWELDDSDNRTTAKEYSSLRELAVERELSYDVLRHVVADDKIGKEIKSRRYRGLGIERIPKPVKAKRGATASGDS